MPHSAGFAGGLRYRLTDEVSGNSPRGPAPPKSLPEGESKETTDSWELVGLLCD